MFLTRKELDKYLLLRRIAIPAELQQDLLEQYGNVTENDEGQVCEYSEQDIYEQLRKILVNFEIHQEDTPF
jgi:hypothetical protein